MNEYGFDYLNYITNTPKKPNYHQTGINQNKMLNYNKDNQAKISMMNDFGLKDPYQGFIKGNLFSNLYDSYKNYTPAELNPNNEKSTLLYQIMQYKFALTDLNLYLDTHPTDTKALAQYNQYLSIEKQMSNKYESLYGPLTTDSNYLGNNAWTWNNSPWPWEGM